MRHTLVIALFVTMLALLLQACGTRGPLYLPPPDSDASAEAKKKPQ
jgi:predicted small lipoprotein YifL